MEILTNLVGPQRPDAAAEKNDGSLGSFLGQATDTMDVAALRAAVLANTGVSTLASFTPPVRARVERWVIALASDDEHQALETFAAVQDFVRELQSKGYDKDPESVAATETVLIALLGHHVNFIRESAVVWLNVLYDGHMLQVDEALPVTIACAGESCSVVVPLVAQRLAMLDSALLSQRTVVLRLFSPDPSRKAPPKWTNVPLTYDEASSSLHAQLDEFPCPGYYDWIIAEPSSLQPAFVEGIPVDSHRRLRGRFVVQPSKTRELSIAEVPVDEIGAVWDEDTGRLRSRGSFDAVLPLLPELQVGGTNAVYLMGALERPKDDAAASPFAVVDRATPSSLLGGEAAFKNLVSEMNRLDIKPIVDGFERVSRTRMHRKYRHLTVETLNSRGIPLRHPGTDGRENQWEDTALLNYRRVEAWDLLISEVKTLATKYGVRGIRLDNAQSLPPILAPFTDELFRQDPDGKPHYTVSEIFFGAVVKANEEFGYWTSDAGLERGYPNPFLVKFCREMWNEFPDFLVVAESNFHREPPLLTSGAVAHSIRIPQIVASISGKSLRRDGTVVRIPGNKRSTARTLSRLFKNDRIELPKNSIMVGSTCTHLSPYPSVLYGRRSWLAVDLLYFLPFIPMEIVGESKGRAYRMNSAPMENHEEVSEYDVHFDAVLPKSPKRSGQSSPAETGLQSLSLGPGGLSASSSRGAGSPATGASSFGSAGGTALGAPTLAKGTLNTGTAPLGGLAAVTSVTSLAGSAPGMMRMTQSQHQQQVLNNGTGTPNSSLTPSSSSLPPTSDSKKPKMKRRGSLADLRRTPSQSNMVRSRSRDDMRGSTVKSMTADDVRRMSSVEHQVREDIDPSSGFDISQIKGHYTHRALLRGQIEALKGGSMCILNVDQHLKEQVFAFARYTEREVVLFIINFADAREGHHHANGCNVELDLRALWDHLPENYVSSKAAMSFYSVVDGFSDAEHSTEIYTLEELCFRGYGVHTPPLSTAMLRLKPLGTSPELVNEHYAQCLQRLQSAEAGDLKDPRENMAIASLARGAATSLSAFATSLHKLREGLRNEGCDDESVLRIMQLCIQRASQLRFLVAYEGVPGPKDFDPPVAERIVAYLTHLSTAARDESLLAVARALVARTTKLGPLVFLTAELGRFSTAGGLGVMVDELTKGLAALGLEVYVISPYYTVNRKNQTGYLGENIHWTKNMVVNLGTHEVECGIFEGVENGVNLVFIERGDYFPKVYADPGGAVRHMQTVILMSLGSLEVCCQKGLTPGLVVSNDWLPSMASGYRNFFGPFFDNTSFYHIIHNLGDGAYEGRCYPSPQEGALEHVHRLPRHLVMNDSWESKVCNPSRTALLTVDNWGTVSPSYLKELLAGHPLSDLLQIAKSPFGYPNGIRQGEREAALRERGAASHEEAKELLQKRYFGFQQGDPSIPLFAFVGRITSQKGVHLILNAVDELIAHTGGKIQILVGGPANYSDAYSAGCARHMHDLKRRHPWCFWAGPDDFFTDGPLVNLGASFGLMPSAFEPGGIVQQEFFVAGTPVVAFRTGGLKDTVHEWRADEMEGNGFTFESYNQGDFVWAVKRALRVFSHPEEYSELRQSAYDTTIDVSQVAWAWSSEFHRLRNAMYTRTEVVHQAISESSTEASDLLDPDARVISLAWTGPGEKVICKGSFDGWTAEWTLVSPAVAIGQTRNGVANGRGKGAVKGTAKANAKTCTIRVRPGEYMYKFKVDGEWTVADDQDTKQDSAGFTNNVVVVR